MVKSGIILLQKNSIKIASKHEGDLYCLNFFHSFSTKNKLKKKHKNVCENYNYCYVENPKEDNKKLKCNHWEKSRKVPFIIYPDLESNHLS